MVQVAWRCVSRVMIHYQLFFCILPYLITIEICWLQKGFKAMPVCLAALCEEQFRWTWNWTLKAWVRSVDANNTDPVDHGCFQALSSVPRWLFCVEYLFFSLHRDDFAIDFSTLFIPACPLRTSCPTCRQRARTSHLRSAGNDRKRLLPVLQLGTDTRI